jgi:tetratricopeptide (TPR) repeat protein
MIFQRESAPPAGRRSWFARFLLLFLVVVLAGCGSGEQHTRLTESTAAEAPAAATGDAPATPEVPAPEPAAAEAPPPTAAEIAALAKRFGLGEPVARSLLVATLPLYSTPSERDERLTALAAELAELVAELQTQAAADEAARVVAEPAVAALQAGDFAAARSTLAEALLRVEADATSSDPARAERLVALRVQAGRIALLQGTDGDAAQILEQALSGVRANQTLLRAQVLGFLGLARLRAGQLAEARMSLELSARLHKGQQGNEHPDVAAAFERLADCYRAEAEYGKAEILYRRALGIWQKQAETSTLEISRAKVRIEAVQRLQGQAPAAPGGESS